MLVLSRKQDEKIITKIGDEVIEYTILRIDNNKVRIGIKASSNVTILRSELIEPQRNSSLIEPVPE